MEANGIGTTRGEIGGVLRDWFWNRMGLMVKKKLNEACFGTNVNGIKRRNYKSLIRLKHVIGINIFMGGNSDT